MQKVPTLKHTAMNMRSDSLDAMWGWRAQCCGGCPSRSWSAEWNPEAYLMEEGSYLLCRVLYTA